VTSSAVSWFDPVTVEVPAEPRAIRRGFGAITLGRAMSLPVFSGAAFGLASFSAFAGDPEIDDLSHVRRLRNCWLHHLRQMRRYSDGAGVIASFVHDRIEAVCQ
jgi:hypothetical protein